MIRHALLLLLATAATALAQTPDTLVGPAVSTPARPTPTMQAARRSGDVSIDGRLDEAAWNAARPATEFTQSWPVADSPASERTEVRVLYDDAALYVGVRMFDSRPDSIAAQLARRDASGIYSDWVHVFIDSYHDRRSGFRFSVNPRGVPKDVFHFNDNNEDLNWDAVWEVGTTIDSLGWVAEYRIPFSQIRFSGAEPAGGRVWGFQVQREIARKEERDSWSPWSRSDAGVVSRFGMLTGLEGVEPVRRMELQPYVSSRLTREPGDDENPFFEDNATQFNAGADFKLGLTSGLTLTGTVNPDFGQVEVDPAVINLSAFESFFSEKRPFFVEGADIFRFGDTRSFNNYNFEEYFYSRRIGRRPQRSLFADGVDYVDSPEQSTILGAIKVSGKAGPWSIGVQDAVTSQEKGRFLDPDGVVRSGLVEPTTNYFVGRVRRDLNASNTIVGGMLTATHRDMGDDGVFAGLLHNRALLGGLDFEHRWGNRRYTLSGYWAYTLVEGDAEAIAATQNAPARYYSRPDATHIDFDPLRTSLEGTMYEVALQRSGDFHWSLDYKVTEPGFEINDLGFHGRTDYQSFTPLIGMRWNTPQGIFRDKGVFAYSYHAWNLDNQAILHGGAIGADFTFTNFWSTGGRVGYRPETYDDRLTRGGPISLNPAYREASMYVNSDSRKRFSYGSEFYYSGDLSGVWATDFSVWTDFRPSTAVRIRLSPGWFRSFNTAQYVTTQIDGNVPTFGSRYIFADLDQNTVLMTTRLDWTFSPTLSLELFAQPLLGAGDYTDYKEFRTPGKYDFDVYGEDKGTIQRGGTCGSEESTTAYLIDPDGAGPSSCFLLRDRDFNQGALRGNAVLRWEYRPGSTLFFVWQQQRDAFTPTGVFDFGRDAGELFSAPATNVFLVKATYWIGR